MLNEINRAKVLAGLLGWIFAVLEWQADQTKAPLAKGISH